MNIFAHFGLFALLNLTVACGGESPSSAEGGLAGSANGNPSGMAGSSPILDLTPGTGNDGNAGTTCDGTLKGYIRDFHDTFPDMEPAHSGKSDDGDDKGIVTTAIGADRKPVYAGPAGGTPTTTGPDNFDKWFRNVDKVNQGLELPLAFKGPDTKGVYTYDNQKFFPIDNQLFGNEGREHNYHFTFELHTSFQYKGGERFTFTGDDDVFTYINGKLVVNLGGIHGAESTTVDLDTLGLTRGQNYPLDFFFAERHVTESHFRIDTSLEFIDCGTVIIQ